MKTIPYILVFYLLTYYGCDSTEPTNQIAGTYIGIYSRTNYVGTDSVSTDLSVVTFEFTDRTYKCESERYLIPPTGVGIYSVDYRIITLTDTVGHSANFDPSLILNGKFAYTFIGNKLTLNQTDNKHKRKHKIELTKQN
jgi:hypothetical protein